MIYLYWFFVKCDSKYVSLGSRKFYNLLQLCQLVHEIWEMYFSPCWASTVTLCTRNLHHINAMIYYAMIYLCLKNSLHLTTMSSWLKIAPNVEIICWICIKHSCLYIYSVDWMLLWVGKHFLKIIVHFANLGNVAVRNDIDRE